MSARTIAIVAYAAAAAPHHAGKRTRRPRGAGRGQRRRNRQDR
jgi:hypothetical protein